MEKDNKKVVVGLSGGVDSSVSLLLLKKQGYQPIGLSLKYTSWQDKRNLLKENICCSQESFAIAKKICQKLKAPYHIVDQKLDFKEKVMGYFLSVLKDKKTPNPCLICNHSVKFNKLFDFAKKHNIKYVATGHYARTENGQLLKAKDKEKDQSYFLALLTKKQLKNIIFPLGNYTKAQVYQIAEKQGFDFFKKIKQSQDLCFVAQKSMPAYLAKEIGLEPGQIVDKKGKILGKHQGLHFYTIGQRKGLNLPQGPWYVIGFDKKKNHLIVTNKEDDKNLFKQTVFVSEVHFISDKIPVKMVKVKAKTRFNQELSSANLYPLKNDQVKLIFDKPQKAVAPGQWAVFYDKDICLGGGVIDK
ncbi:MAG: tRNA 2-thiouridine(34) synthase MnmA [Parcubacteria group bacterium]|jgi:tRNA-specific 2-thiouridylase|nr:tRNA 2-thiouridine(34) synthase MnmA [Parcubacteria group bacterium]|tara:strand:+ start:81 stop:1154 length:1074 start_codon:yes stop_codon:yes gene_type:complete